MLINIRLQSFRSYADESFDFSPSVNIVVGPNASGKTNLLEAIYVLGTGASYKTGDEDLVQHTKPWARLDAELELGKRTLKIEKSSNGITTKTFVVNNDSLRRLSAQRKLPIVLFEPNHLLLFHLGPEARRTFIDDLIAVTNPTYQQIRTQYRRTLAQRNALLKQHQAIKKQLFVWNVRLSELGGTIAQERHKLIEQLQEKLPAIYKTLAESDKAVAIRYVSQLPIQDYSSHLLRQLEEEVERDVQRGFTGYGPHRDDLEVDIGSHSMRESASRGETRTVLLALKIMELKRLQAKADTKPLLLLDDVFSELDGARRQALTKAIAGHQTFITTTDADIVVQHFLERCNVIPVTNNQAT
jgi:DNA replication and repair protein RecF